MSRIPEITHTRLVTANVYYGLFGKLTKDHSQDEDFKISIVEGSSLAKVVKTPAPLYPTNGSRGHYFGFVKCLSYLKAT